MRSVRSGLIDGSLMLQKQLASCQFWICCFVILYITGKVEVLEFVCIVDVLEVVHKFCYPLVIS